MNGCKHRHTTVVQATVHDGDEFLGVCLLHQCDDCGMPVPSKEVDEELFEGWMWGGVEVPEVDRKAEGEAIDRVLRTLLKTDERIVAERVWRMAPARG
jgi:hypothetical protein